VTMPPKPRATTSTASKSARKRTGPPKKQRSAIELSRRLYTTLCKQIDGVHFSNAIKTCDKILALDPRDKDALQTKLFLLLQTDQYLPALAVLDANGNSDGAYERAYSLYRLQRESEAEQVLGNLKAAKQDDHGMLHLEAQLSYRQGNYQSAFDLYSQLLDSPDLQPEEHADILTNLQAAQKHLDFTTKDYLRSLDALDNTITSTLESAPPPAQPGASIAPIQQPAASAPTREAPKKSVRMRRVPKGVVPGVTPPPDPERWLKKTERTTYQPPRGKRKGGGATQGIVEGAVGASASGHAKSGKGKRKK